MATNSFGARSTLSVEGDSYTIFKLEALEKRGFSLARMPYSIKVMLENVLRREDGVIVTTGQIEALAKWHGKGGEREVSFMPARVLLQDFTGVPVVADLAAMRDAIKKLGGDPAKISPLQPVDLVIDHSVQVDSFGSADSFAANARLEFERNRERYLFLRWGQGAFDNFRVVPPDTGIVHQVNLEYLAPVVVASDKNEAYPDTVIGTDSRTTMSNGLGVVGWGVGGIEAEAAMLGRSMPMLIPEVIGFRLTGSLRPGATATDLVLTVTQMLRRKGVVGKFVEYFGPGLASLPVADRATLGNMSPEYGATMGFFPVDAQTLTYLRLTGRSESQVKLIEAYCKAQGLFNSADAPEPKFSDTLELDLGSVVPSMAGPRRPQDRVALTAAKGDFRRELAKEFEEHPSVDRAELAKWVAEGGIAAVAGEGTILESKLGHIAHKVEVNSEGGRFPLTHGSIVIAAITSCTNTSNPSVMLAAGILARKAVARGLTVKPWVKTSLAPGSKVVTQYLKRAGLTESLDKLRFNLVGYGCTTCIGNSGPIAEAIAGAVKQGNLFRWEKDSSYVKAPPFFDGVTAKVGELSDISGARALAVLGDSVTTDHISPAGSIAADSPAGKYLIARGVQPKDFNSYGSRRGNHEVMMRGTLANIRLKNLMVPGVEGGFTAHIPDGERMTIFDASELYRKAGTALIVIAGKEYGTGSSRDWAA